MDLEPLIIARAAAGSVDRQASQSGARDGGVIEQLRSLVGVAPPDATVTVRWIAELLDGAGLTDLADREDGSCSILPDLTVDDIMTATQRQRPTVIGWIRGGDFPGAYKLNGREWRIPQTDWTAFLERKRNCCATDPPATVGRRVDLGRWRAHVVRRIGKGSASHPP
jgi:hypothetical protein